MDYPVDEAAHRNAHDEKAARLVVDDLKYNWVHLMNYADEPQPVTVYFDAPVRAKVISPDKTNNLTLEGDQISFSLDIYSILMLE